MSHVWKKPSALGCGQVFIIPEDMGRKKKREELPCNQVSMVPIKDLVTFQKGMTLKIAATVEFKKVGPAGESRWSKKTGSV